MKSKSQYIIVLVLLLSGFSSVFAQAEPAAANTEIAPASESEETQEDLLQKLENVRAINEAAREEQEIDEQGRPKKQISSLILETVLALGAVLGLIFILVTILKKMKKNQESNDAGGVGDIVRTLGSVWIGNGQKISLVLVDDKVMILGITNDNIRTLDILEGESAHRVVTLTSKGTISATQFSEVVNNLLGSFKRGGGEKK